MMNDLINRGDALAVVQYSEDKVEGIKNLPAADAVEVVHAKWEQCFEDYRKQIEGDKCSACGFEHYGTSIRNYKYCPNCGARMDGE